MRNEDISFSVYLRVERWKGLESEMPAVGWRVRGRGDIERAMGTGDVDGLDWEVVLAWVTVTVAILQAILGLIMTVSLSLIHI